MTLTSKEIPASLLLLFINYAQQLHAFQGYYRDNRKHSKLGKRVLRVCAHACA